MLGSRVWRGLLGGASAPQDARALKLAGAPSDAATAHDAGAVQDILEKSDSLAAEGRFADSLALLDDALSRFHDDGKLLLARASTLYGWGRLREALEDFRRAEATGLTGATLDGRIGWSCLQLGLSDEAETRMRRVVAAEPDAAEAHFSLGVVLAARAQYAEAIGCYRSALERAPDHKHCLVNLGICLMQSGDLTGAEATFRHAAERHPDNPVVWMNLGTVRHRLDRDDAFDAFARAEALDPDARQNADNFSNYGNALQNSDRVQQALALYERYLPTCPHAVAHGNYSMALMAAGRWSEAWNHYEFRWMQDALAALRAEFDVPLWAGQDLRGKTILLRAEQGVGDVIQFIRYAPLVKALGARVVLQNRTNLDELATSFPGVDHVLRPKEAMPEFDYYAHLMGLPRVFGTEVDSVPDAVPYLDIAPELLERWRQRFASDGRLKIGLVWAGSPTHVRDRYRSTSLQALAPLLDVPGTSWYSLQKGPAAAALVERDNGGVIVDLQDELTDFAETAAAVSALDLIVSVDTSVAHLAGALGKPLWMMLAHPAEWRWLEHRDDTPWYPTARLFRQTRMNEWHEVVQRMKPALAEVVSQHRSGAAPSAGMVPKPARAARAPHVPDGFMPVAVAFGMSAVWEMHAGILQYLPEEDDCNRSLHWYGEWLQPQLDLLTRLIRRDQTILEAGSGVGAHTVPLARALGPNGHLLAYESRPRQLRVLRQNLSANGLRNATVMTRTLAVVPDKGADHGLPPAAQAAETVDQLRLRRLDWLKINTDAAATDVVAGAAQTLWRLRPRLMITVPTGEAVTQLADLLREFGYRCWRQETPLFNAANFNRHDRDVFGGRVVWTLLGIPEEVEVDVALDGCVEIS
jgi:tetratricopeptide (TPR) repeat protein/precorrin-6B methylase 2